MTYKGYRYHAIFMVSMCLFMCYGQLWGHAKDQSYLYLRIYQNHIEGTVETTYKDLNLALDLGLERGMQLSDLAPYLTQIQDYIRQGVSIRSADGEHQIRFVEPRLMEAKLGVFLKSDFVLENVNAIPEALDVSYDLIFDQDPSHRAFLVIRHHWPSGIIDNEGIPYAGFTPGDKMATMALTGGSISRGVWKVFKMGLQHLLTGIDHILFVLACIVPFVVGGRRNEVDQHTPAAGLLHTHSRRWVALFVTGLLPGFFFGASGLLTLGSSLVEGAIALSIGIAAFSRMRDFRPAVQAVILVLSGVFHGLGFASVLLGKNLRGEYMSESMCGFSLGILIGILIIIAMFYFVSRMLSARIGYQKWIKYFLMLCLAISAYCLIERVFGIDLLIDTYIGKAFGKVFGIFHSH